MAQAIAQELRLTRSPVVRSRADLVAEFRDQAAGPTLDQQMSSRKIRNQLGRQP